MQIFKWSSFEVACLTSHHIEVSAAAGAFKDQSCSPGFLHHQASFFSQCHQRKHEQAISFHNSSVSEIFTSFCNLFNGGLQFYWNCFSVLTGLGPDLLCCLHGNFQTTHTECVCQLFHLQKYDCVLFFKFFEILICNLCFRVFCIH